MTAIGFLSATLLNRLQRYAWRSQSIYNAECVQRLLRSQYQEGKQTKDRLHLPYRHLSMHKDYFVA